MSYRIDIVQQARDYVESGGRTHQPLAHQLAHALVQAVDRADRLQVQVEALTLDLAFAEHRVVFAAQKANIMPLSAPKSPAS